MSKFHRCCMRQSPFFLSCWCCWCQVGQQCTALSAGIDWWLRFRYTLRKFGWNNNSTTWKWTCLGAMRNMLWENVFKFSYILKIEERERVCVKQTFFFRGCVVFLHTFVRFHYYFGIAREPIVQNGLTNAIMLIKPFKNKVYINQHNNDKFSRLLVVVEPFISNFFSLLRLRLDAAVATFRAVWDFRSEF